MSFPEFWVRGVVRQWVQGRKQRGIDRLATHALIPLESRMMLTAAGSDAVLNNINHVVVIYQENWSFDGLYGSLPGVNGIANASPTSLNQVDRVSGQPLAATGGGTYNPAFTYDPKILQSPPPPLDGSNKVDTRFVVNTTDPNSPTIVNTFLPYDVGKLIPPTAKTGDLVHRYWQEQSQLDSGKNDKFITWSDNPGLVMSHFDASTLPEGLLAQQYTIDDNFFHAAYGGSFLNHQFLVAGQAPVFPNAPSSLLPVLDSSGQLALDANGKIVQDGKVTPINGTFDKNYAVNTIFSKNLVPTGTALTNTGLLPSQNDSNPAAPNYIPTIGDTLDTAGVTWKWYSGGWNAALASSPSNPANNGVTPPNPTVDPNFQWHHQPLAYYDNFAPWLPNGQRNPLSAAHLQDESNLFTDAASGNLPAASFVKALGPDNEHPGYASLQQGQQHVADIVAALQKSPDWQHTAVIVTYDENGGRWDHVSAPSANGIWGDGSRVPTLVISPYAKRGYVDHTQHDTLSILKTIETRFNLPALSQFDAAASTLSNDFKNDAGPGSGTTTPNSPFALKVTGATSSSVSLQFNDNSTDETGFVILRTDGKGGSAVLNAPASAGTGVVTFSDTTIQPGVSYTYAAQAINGDRVSNLSLNATVTTPTTGSIGGGTSSGTVPNTPFNVSATATSPTSVTVKFNDNSTDETSFTIVRHSPGSPDVTFTLPASAGIGQVTYTDNTVAAGTTYGYTVQALNGSVGSNVTAPPATVTTPGISAGPGTGTIPNRPFNLTALATSPTSVAIQFYDNSDNETSFVLDRQVNGGPVTAITVPASPGKGPVNFTDSTAAAGTTYTYTVRALNGALTTAPEGPVTVSTPATGGGTIGGIGTGVTPNTPFALTATIKSSTDVQLSFVDNANNATRVEIERSVDGGAFALLTTLPGQTTTSTRMYDDMTTAGGHTYAYRLKAYNGPLGSNYAGPVTAAVPLKAMFNAVAAGDATSSDAILWTRAVDASNPTSTSLTAQVSTDPSFASGVLTYTGATSAAADFTLKLDATGLQPGTKYYYRFAGPNGVTSNAGTFKTQPAPTTAAPVHFGFSGDVNGSWRPYPLTASIPAQNFDAYIFLGDTIYEAASGTSGQSNFSAATTSTTSATPAQLLADYHRKYREQLLPVNAGGQAGLTPFFAGQGNYTLLDNHELGNKQDINGGAPAGGPIGGSPSGAGVDATSVANDVNTSGTFINKTPSFQALEQAYLDYQPVKDRGTISTPATDPRSDGTKQLYYAQQFGKNAVFVNVDDRTYRDIRLKTASGADDTGPRADNPNRTMLGATELAWLENTLLTAQTSGTPWKFVAVSSPIDQIGAIGSGADGGKSWMGGYRAERNKLMKFIADNHITNVVFLSTDDHQNRVNELLYSPTGDTANQASYVKVPGVFEIVDGPMGADSPDLVTDHSFSNLKSLADTLAATQTAAGVDPIGLDKNYAGLHNVTREGDPTADTTRQPIDFYSPDTYNYSSLDVSADGKTLTVTSYGINGYAPNTFPEASTTGAPRQLLGFQITTP